MSSSYLLRGAGGAPRPAGQWAAADAHPPYCQDTGILQKTAHLGDLDAIFFLADCISATLSVSHVCTKWAGHAMGNKGMLCRVYRLRLMK